MERDFGFMRFENDPDDDIKYLGVDADFLTRDEAQEAADMWVRRQRGRWALVVKAPADDDRRPDPNAWKSA